MKQLRELTFALMATFRDMLPILITIGVFEFLVLRRVPADPAVLVLGLLAMLIGLTFMVRGLEMSLFPIGEALADAIARHGHPVWIMVFAFSLGFGSTIAEPALAAVAAEAAAAMTADPDFPADEAHRETLALQIRYGIATGLGVALMIGVWRILKGWPITWLVLPGYGVIALVTLLTDASFVAVALDAGTAATSVINIPLMLALGIGLATVLRSRDPLVDGFGIVVLASLTPMLMFLAVAFLLVPGV